MISGKITGTGDTTLVAAVAAPTDVVASLGVTAINALRAVTGNQIAVVDMANRKVGIWPANSTTRGAIGAKYINVGNQKKFTVTKDDATKTSSSWTTHNAGYSPAHGGNPDYWTSDNGSGNPPDVGAAAGGPASDAQNGVAVAIEDPTKAAMSTSGLIGAIEDALPNGNSAIVVVDQETQVVTVIQSNTAEIAALGVTTAAGSTAIFTQTPNVQQAGKEPLE